MAGGEVGTGGPLERTRVNPEELTVQDVLKLRYFDQDNLEGAKKAARIQAFSPGWRRVFVGYLAKAGISL